MSMFFKSALTHSIRSKLTAAALVAGLTGTAALLPQPTSAEASNSPDMAMAQTFACGEAGKMKVLFTSQTGQFDAHVLWPGQPVRALHILPANGEPRVAWSDGSRTLVWNPGVQLTWTDRSTGAVHCNRDGGHNHGQPAQQPRHVHTSMRGI